MKNVDELNTALSLHNFVKESSESGGLTKESAESIKDLVNQYRLLKPTDECSIISADFGKLGSIVVRDIEQIEDSITLKYEPGSYDLISILSSNTRRILWTDYKNIEPYNRQSGLYCSGASWRILGDPVHKDEDYREFDVTTSGSNISFGVEGFSFNTFYDTVSFGLCIKTDQVDEFITEIRELIGK